MSRIAKVDDYCLRHLYDLLDRPHWEGVTSLAILNSFSLTVNILAICRGLRLSDEPLWSAPGPLAQRLREDFGWTHDAYAWHSAYACEATQKEGLLPIVPLIDDGRELQDRFEDGSLLNPASWTTLQAKFSYYCCSGFYCAGSFAFADTELPWIHFEIKRDYPKVAVVAIRRGFERKTLETPHEIGNGFFGVEDVHESVYFDGFRPGGP